jgi:hypothetical protein
LQYFNPHSFAAYRSTSIRISLNFKKIMDFSPSQDKNENAKEDLILNETFEAPSSPVEVAARPVAKPVIKKTLGFSVAAKAPLASLVSSKILTKPQVSALATAFSVPTVPKLVAHVSEGEDDDEDSQAVKKPAKKKTKTVKDKVEGETEPKKEKKAAKKPKDKPEGDDAAKMAKKATKKAKDPNAPKPAPTAYNLFNKENRALLAAANPDADFGEMGKIVGAAWKALSTDESNVYVDKARELKKLLPPKLVVPTGLADIVQSTSSSSSVLGSGLVKKKPSLLPAIRKPLVLDSLATKDKTGKQKAVSSSGGPKRKRKAEDDDGSDGFNSDDVIIIKDPRAEARLEALARKKQGVSSVIKGGEILDAEGYDESLVLPKLTGKMDYSHALFSVEDDISLIIPCFNEWLVDLQSSTIPTHALYIDKTLADVALSILSSSGPDAVKALLPYHSWTKNAAIFGSIISIVPLPSLLVSKEEALSSSSSSSSAAATAELIDSDDETLKIIKKVAPTLSSSTASKRSSQQVMLVTIAINEVATRAGGFHLVSSELELGQIQTEEQGDEDKKDAEETTIKINLDEEDVDDDIIRPRLQRVKSKAPGKKEEALLVGGKGFQGILTRTSTSHAFTITVPWLPPSHPLVDSPFIISSDCYEFSDSKGIRAGQQIRNMTVTAETSTGSGARGEWNEGRCYNSGARRSEVTAGWPHSLYKSISVVWYAQDIDTEAWFIDPRQEANQLSPWQVCTDKLPFCKISDSFVQEVPALSTPKAVLEYVCSLEASGPFLKPVAKTETAYYARIKQPIDLSIMTRRAVTGGKYEDGSESLWNDLRLLIFNAKLFNQPITNFFRMADMLEVEVRKVKKAYTGPATSNIEGATSNSSSSSSSSGARVSSQVPFDENEYEKIDMEEE